MRNETELLCEELRVAREALVEQVATASQAISLEDQFTKGMDSDDKPLCLTRSPQDYRGATIVHRIPVRVKAL